MFDGVTVHLGFLGAWSRLRARWTRAAATADDGDDGVKSLTLCTVHTHLVCSAHVLPVHTSRTAFAVTPNSAAMRAA
eukprot:CAMPEP_0173078366 /NCGR_PEP_ID=MMETSP1102-20130122/14059_1 /TAXON_ID=49646 /ORGANISM="Geminigera sp., Strain Caron Lab Isolate" /LENGTH=76 /DNA_ID=CAMNT_0013949591 /DNA_START=165 /DNA_END=392 /DNA_ORIENTATION=+